MSRLSSAIFGLLAIALLLSACRKTDVGCDQVWGEEDFLELPPGFPPVEYPEDNTYSEARWKLGKRLFYDPILSRLGTHSCGSCHDANMAFADDLPTTPGILQRPGKRNAPSLANVAYQPYFLREGSVQTLEMQVLVPIQEANEFDHNIVDLSYQLREDSSYVVQSMEAYGRLPDPFVITRAIATFERTLISGRSPYDQYVFQGCTSALSPMAEKGMELFFGEKAGCGGCHSGFNFSNYAFENNGLYENYEDPGRFRFTGDSSDLARFKVPSLRNVARTAPYMHDGSIASLQAVIEHYNQGGAGHRNQSPLVKPLHLTELEKESLLQFLHSLTDEAFIQQPAFRN